MGLVTANQFQTVPNIPGALSQGINLGDQFRQQQLQQKQQEFLAGGGLQQPGAVQESGKLGLDFQQKVAEGLGIIDKRTRQIDQVKLVEAADFSFRIQGLPVEQQNIAIQERIETLEGQGRDATQTRELLQTPFEQRGRALQAVQLSALPNDQRLKFLQNAQRTGQTKFQFGAQESFKDEAGNVFFATTRRDPRAGDVTPQVTPLIEGTQVQGQLTPISAQGVTSAERSAERQLVEEIKTTEAEKREVAKLTTKRKQGFVDSGVEAADGVANIKRSIQLLEDVPTGGIDAALLRGKQLFGIESADEAELSSGLGKAILSQLRPIFGAAFTENEGRRLERIEAGFGKSTEGNKRLLDQLLKIVERSAKRGLAAAEDLNDDFTANEIREALQFDLAPEVAEQAIEADPGIIMEDAQGNRARVFKDGRIEEL